MIESNDKKIIISNPDNMAFVNLKNYPQGANKEVEKGIDMKMYDFMKSCNSEYDTLSAINYLGKQYTYDSVFIQIEKYAKALKAYGIEQGDYVSLMLPNIPEIVYIKFALNRIGAVSNLIDPRNNPNTILEYVNNANSKMLITVLDKYKSTVEPIIDKLRVDDIFSISPLESISLDELNFSDGYFKKLKTSAGFFLYEYKKLLLNSREIIKRTGKFHDISALLKWEQQHTGSLDTEYVPFDPATVLYTSGTTGGMKGALTSNEAYNSIYKNLKYGVTTQTPGEKFCGIIPYFTSYGSGVGMFNSMCNRFEQYLYPNFHPQDFVKIVERDKPNAIVGVPKFYEMLVDAKANVPDLKHIVIGGDKILPEKVQEFKNFFDGKEVIIGYGETEFLGVLAVTLDNNARLDSSGVPLPGVRVKIVNPETLEELPFMQEGEAYINSMSMMLDYLNKHDELEKIQAFDEEGNKYYGTGDKMYLTPDGQLCFVDRYKRLMKRPDGHQVNANPIEVVVSNIEGVKECCVVGLKYKTSSGVIPTAFVTLENDQIDKNLLIQKFEYESIQKLPSYREKALAYVFVDKLPITKMGKIDAFTLASQKLEDITDAIIVDYTFIDKETHLKK